MADFIVNLSREEFPSETVEMAMRLFNGPWLRRRQADGQGGTGA